MVVTTLLLCFLESGQFIVWSLFTLVPLSSFSPPSSSDLLDGGGRWEGRELFSVVAWLPGLGCLSVAVSDLLDGGGWEGGKGAGYRDWGG